MIHAATNKISLATTSKCSKHGHKLILMIDLSYLDFQLSNLEVILEENEIFSPKRDMKSCTMLFSQFLLVAFLFCCSDLLHNYPHKDNNLQAHLQHQFIGKPSKNVNN